MSDHYREAYYEMENKYVKLKVERTMSSQWSIYRKLLNALKASIASMRGYRRERNDGNPCDAEKHAVALLEELGERTDD